MTNLAILGRRGSGKTTVANALVAMGYTRHSWAAPVKEIASWAYGEIDKAANYTVSHLGAHLTVSGRWILQRIGTDALRNQVDTDFWIKVGLRKIDAAEMSGHSIIWVNDDTRFPNEVAALRSRDFVIAYLNVPDEIRVARLGAEYDPSADNHPSETSVRPLDADILLDGARTVDEIVGNLLAATT